MWSPRVPGVARAPPPRIPPMGPAAALDVEGVGDSCERLLFSFAGTLPATVTTITRSPCAAGDTSASRSSVGPLERAYSSTADQSGMSALPEDPSTYPARHGAAPSQAVIRGASESQASALICPSL